MCTCVNMLIFKTSNKKNILSNEIEDSNNILLKAESKNNLRTKISISLFILTYRFWYLMAALIFQYVVKFANNE